MSEGETGCRLNEALQISKKRGNFQTLCSSSVLLKNRIRDPIRCAK